MLKLIVRDGWASASQQLLDTAPAGVDMRLCTHLSVLPYEVYAEWERNVDANFAETFGSHSINMILAEGLLRTVDAVQGANGQQLPLQRGCKALVQHLKTEPALNGQLVDVLGLKDRQRPDGRWKVRIDQNGTVALKPDNLRAVDDGRGFHDVGGLSASAETSARHWRQPRVASSRSDQEQVQRLYELAWAAGFGGGVCNLLTSQQATAATSSASASLVGLSGEEAWLGPADHTELFSFLDVDAHVATVYACTQSEAYVVDTASAQFHGTADEQERFSTAFAAAVHQVISAHFAKEDALPLMIQRGGGVSPDLILGILDDELGACPLLLTTTQPAAAQPAVAPPAGAQLAAENADAWVSCRRSAAWVSCIDLFEFVHAHAPPYQFLVVNATPLSAPMREYRKQREPAGLGWHHRGPPLCLGHWVPSIGPQSLASPPQAALFAVLNELDPLTLRRRASCQQTWPGGEVFSTGSEADGPGADGCTECDRLWRCVRAVRSRVDSLRLRQAMSYWSLQTSIKTLAPGGAAYWRVRSRSAHHFCEGALSAEAVEAKGEAAVEAAVEQHTPAAKGEAAVEAAVEQHKPATTRETETEMVHDFVTPLPFFAPSWQSKTLSKVGGWTS